MTSSSPLIQLAELQRRNLEAEGVQWLFARQALVSRPTPSARTGATLHTLTAIRARVGKGLGSVRAVPVRLGSTGRELAAGTNAH